jgi:hypothetical protein
MCVEFVVECVTHEISVCAFILHGAISMGRKEFLPVEQKMDAAAFVDRARKMAATLEDREIAEARSRPIARQRVSRLARVPTSLLHSLRYRPPKQIAADVFARLCAAIERQAADQIRKAEHEISTARMRRLGADDSALCEIETALANARALMEGVKNGKATRK